MKLYLKQTTILMGMCSALGMYAPEVQASNGEANSLIATSVQQTKKVTGNQRLYGSADWCNNQRERNR